MGARGLVCPGGLLAVMSSYNWDANRTPRSLWLGDPHPDPNHQAETESHKSPSKVLQERLHTEFNFISEHEVPLVWQTSSSQLCGQVFMLSLFSRKL